MFETARRDCIELARTPVVQPGNDPIYLHDVFSDQIRGHLGDADTQGGRVHIVLTVSQLRDHGNLKTCEEPHEQAKAFRVLSCAIGNNGKIPFAPVELCNQQEICDEARGRIDVDL